MSPQNGGAPCEPLEKEEVTVCNTERCERYCENGRPMQRRMKSVGLRLLERMDALESLLFELFQWLSIAPSGLRCAAESLRQLAFGRPRGV